LKDKLLHFRS